MLARIIADGEPLFVDAATADPFLRAVLGRAGAGTIVAAPIVGGGEFLGIISAGTATGSGLLRRDGHDVGLLFVDLDRLKHVNDTFGHLAGDEVICMAAVRLRGCLRDSDVLARLGGDELVVLLPQVVRPSDAADVAARILAARRAPFVVAGHSLEISASIGVVVAPGGTGTCDALLADADAAMYESKARGGDAFSVHARGSAGGAHSPAPSASGRLAAR